MRRLVALALCATSAAAAAVAHSLDNFVWPGVHHASFFDVDASVSAQTSADGLDVIWANHLDESAMDVRRSSASAGSGSRSRASSESRSRETSEHAAAPPYPSPASLSRSI